VTLAPHLRRGAEAEVTARTYLEARGLRTITRNFRTPRGELDLVMRDGETLVFVEVRYRATRAFGLAQETVGHRKQSKLVTAAQYYLRTRPGDAGRPCRFDVVALHGSPAGDNRDDIEWLKNAFDS